MNNKISQKGFNALVKALQTNITLKYLNILNNNFNKEDELKLLLRINELLERNRKLAAIKDPIERANLIAEVKRNGQVFLFNLNLICSEELFIKH